MSQKVLTRESHARCPHGTHKTPEAATGRAQGGFVLQQEISEHTEYPGMLSSAGACCLDSNGRWWQGSISSFLSSVSLFSVCAVGISPSEGRLSSALIPQTFCCWLQQRNLCRIDGVFSLNAWEHSEQGRLDGSVLLQRIPATSGLTLRRDACFHFSWWQLAYSSKIITAIIWECWKLSKAVLRWCWVVFPAQRTFVASSFKVQPVLTGKVGRCLSDARASLCLKSLLANHKDINYAKMDWWWVEFLLAAEAGAKEPPDPNLKKN